MADHTFPFALRRAIVAGAACVAAIAVAVSGVRASDTPAACQTTIPAGLVVSQTWTAAASPYCITGDIQVSLLTIQPGVSVLVDGPYGIEVLSTIQAVGTADDPILFAPTATASAPWRGLRFQSTPSGSQLVHCIVQGSMDSAIKLVSAYPPLMEDCVFSGNSRTGFGGAMDVDGTSGDLVLTRCRFLDNTSTRNGGALRLNVSDGTKFVIYASTFSGNSTDPGQASGEFGGGAVWIQSGTGMISGSHFIGNQAHSWVYGTCTLGDCSFPDTTARGGAIYLTAGTLTIESSEIRANAAVATKVWPYCTIGGCGSAPHPATMIGGGVFVESGDVAIANSSMACNTSDTAGGGLYVKSGTASLQNSTIVRNPDAPGIANEGGTVTLDSSILFFNNGNQDQISGTVAVAYSDVQGGYAGTGNINLQPVFAGTQCDPDSLRIVAGSPAIDAGNPDPTIHDTCFPPSLGSTRNDMGWTGGPGACDVPSSPTTTTTSTSTSSSSSSSSSTTSSSSTSTSTSSTSSTSTSGSTTSSTSTSSTSTTSTSSTSSSVTSTASTSSTTVSTPTASLPSTTTTLPPEDCTRDARPGGSPEDVECAITTIEATLARAPQPQCTARCNCSLASPLARVSTLIAGARGATKAAKCTRKLDHARQASNALRKRVTSLVKRHCIASPDLGSVLRQQTAELSKQTTALFESRFCAEQARGR